MWETALAFAIWGTYGSILTAAHIGQGATAAILTVPMMALLVALGS